MQLLTKRLLPLALVGVLSGCSLDFSDLDFDLFSSSSEPKTQAPLTQLPPAPKPLYQPGDTYIYNDDGTVVQEQVVGVTPDRVTWTNDSGLIWTTTNELIAPQLSWSSHPELGRGRQTVIGNPGALFPLQEGNVVAFGVRGNSEKVPTGWEDEVRCVVAGQEDVTVPAGTFTTFRIDCKRRDVAASIYYAPVAQNYVLRERTFTNSSSRKELMSVSLADNRTSDLPVTVEKPKEATDVVNPKRAVQESMKSAEAAASMKDDMSKMEGSGAAMKAEDSGGDMRLNMLISRLEAVVSKLEGMSSEKMMAEKPAMAEEAAKEPEKMESKVSASGKYGIHIESYRTTRGARRGWDALTKRFPKELEGLSFKTVEFDAGDGRGTFVRLVGAAFQTRGDALAACRPLKAKRQFCQPVRIAR